MKPGLKLEDALRPRQTSPHSEAIIQTIISLSDAAKVLSNLLAKPALAGKHGANTGVSNADGDQQRALDLVADDVFMGFLRQAPVAYAVSEEAEKPVILRISEPLVVAIDPLDGSSNLDVNAPVGTIFSIFPHLPAEAPTASFLRQGKEQLAAGFFIYGTQTSLIVCLGDGVHLFTLDRNSDVFLLVSSDIKIPNDVPEYAINASNYRHWHEPVQSYIDDCIQGSEGPRGKNFNMRWIASLVADSFRIFTRGGIFLYPADDRKGYEHGRLRHLYEANPIAFLASAAGGDATNGAQPILDLIPSSLHARVPLVMGSADKVSRVRAYYADPSSVSQNAPLFKRRGLLRTE
jgi:fructose-1,6-bisphosphatase I